VKGRRARAAALKENPSVAVDAAAIVTTLVLV